MYLSFSLVHFRISQWWPLSRNSSITLFGQNSVPSIRSTLSQSSRSKLTRHTGLLAINSLTIRRAWFAFLTSVLKTSIMFIVFLTIALLIFVVKPGLYNLTLFNTSFLADILPHLPVEYPLFTNHFTNHFTNVLRFCIFMRVQLRQSKGLIATMLHANFES